MPTHARRRARGHMTGEKKGKKAGEKERNRLDAGRLSGETDKSTLFLMEKGSLSTPVVQGDLRYAGHNAVPYLCVHACRDGLARQDSPEVQ